MLQLVCNKFVPILRYKPRSSAPLRSQASIFSILVSIALLFKNSTAGMQFLLSFHRFRHLLNSATVVLSSRIDAHTIAGPQRVFAFPQESQASKASPEMSHYQTTWTITPGQKPTRTRTDDNYTDTLEGVLS